MSGFDDLPITSQKKELRRRLIEERLSEFCNLRNDDARQSNLSAECQMLFDPQAATRINDAYWVVIEQYVKKRLECRVSDDVRADPHKILAGTEYAVMSTLCVRYNDDFVDQPTRKASENPRTIELNADFTIYLTFKMFEMFFHDLSAKPILDRESYIREHTTWLINQPTEGIQRFQLFLRAQVWYFIEELCKLECKQLA